MVNAWCQTLGIVAPRLEHVEHDRAVSPYSLLLLALLERGRPMTLLQVALRIEEVGLMDRHAALEALQRCEPLQPPLVREGELCRVDLGNAAELEPWLSRLGLRETHAISMRIARDAAPGLPALDTALSLDEVNEAWNDAYLVNWPARHLVLAVLDVYREPVTPRDVIAFVAERAKYHRLTDSPRKFRGKDSPVRILFDGRWAIAERAETALLEARRAVRGRLESVRRSSGFRLDPSEAAAQKQSIERQRAADQAKRAALRRALLTTFPLEQPEAAALLDISKREIQTFVGSELELLRQRLAEFDSIGAIDVRTRLAELGFEPNQRQLDELGPPQKRKRLANGKVLKITATLLIRGSCGIRIPFGDEKKLRYYLDKPDRAKARRRLETDLTSLFSFYQYGRVHGSVRLKWESIDERIPAPWVYRSEPVLYHLKRAAAEKGVPLEVVVGNAPSLENPWERVQLAHVEREGFQEYLLDEDGWVIEDEDVQLARLVE